MPPSACHRRVSPSSSTAPVDRRVAKQEVATMSRHMISRRSVLLGGAALSGFVAAPAIVRAQAAEIAVGFVTGQTGPGASIGIPYSRGIAASMAYLDTIEGHKIRLIQM